ncbi:unnamed protein product [Schistosoma curassoni]|uniref:CRAL-TRIO domain-containing protein n=1 Tax=Schistosoma curassoni TaxID=6186 RepID=A0A183KMD9_9TREM|nr:unnamed protein product [Schistosoma curassoni]
MIQLDRILEDPRVQICGLRVFIDFTGVSPSLLDTINPKKTIKDLSKVLQIRNRLCRRPQIKEYNVNS